MAKRHHGCSVARVMENQDLVANIIERAGSSLSMFRCSAVDSTWLQATRSPNFSVRFAERNTPANLGFLVEFQNGDGRVMRLLYAYAPGGDETANALRPWVDPLVLEGDDVLASGDGIILVMIPEDFGATADVYYTSSPSRRPRVYKAEGPRIPSIVLSNPAKINSNTFGQFGVLPAAGPSGMSFFVKEPTGPYLTTYAGVSFSSTAKVYIHTSIFKDGVWNPIVSPPILSPEPAVFHRNPYSILVGGRLYMMYLLGSIVSLDIASSSFRQIPLPSGLNGRVSSWYDYTVARHSGGGVVLVSYRQGKINTWVLSHLSRGIEWTLQSSLDLPLKIGSRVGMWTWERVFLREEYPEGHDHYYSVQVRSASLDGRFVFLTFGFEAGMFEVNTVKETVRMISGEREGMIDRIYNLSEEWPPKHGH